MAMENNMTGYIVLTVIFKPEDEVWTVECKELGTATFGDTFAEAKQNLEEAIVLHLNTLAKVDELERFFKEHGIKVYQDQPEQMRIELPFDPSILVSQTIQPINFGLAYV